MKSGDSNGPGAGGHAATVAEFLSVWVVEQIEEASGPPVLFISGAQGIGKSTAVQHLSDASSVRIATMGIDDFYLPKRHRLEVAAKVDPLFETRGPPGTHEVDLLCATIVGLTNAGSDRKTVIPTFNKLTDTRRPKSGWRVFEGRPDAVIVEGWLMGVQADRASVDEPPLNCIEAADRDKAWRRYQEEKLEGPYRLLRKLADGYLHVDAPNFETVASWRIQQEETLRGAAPGALPARQQEKIRRFVQFYERLTRRMLAGRRVEGRVVPVDASRRPLASLPSA